MPRFFVEGAPAGAYLLAGEDGRHGAKSLRLRPGEAVTLCDGRGSDYHGVVQEVLPQGLLLDVGQPVPSRGEPAIRVTVCQCLPKADKLETVAQKSVELGAAALWPIESSRCVARWEPKAVPKKLERLQKIVREAAMQSGRGIIPPVLEPAPLAKALESAVAQGEALFLYEGGGMGFKAALQSLRPGLPLFLFVGPEGGFSPAEAALARRLGARPVTLGPRILRTETAPLAALSATLYEKGEMEP
ncbi:RsmE family RNA methyltransferase [Acutalibacter caecimuris]|uniref:RsmE family RNA methyltransferase n=1 Tax=Acutalibacter caecimuris TaxID=3093657 RepID=UPI002AC8B3B3|nr:RsmE family RNA methyltransferase [Acutalibacter sp. M00118]